MSCEIECPRLMLDEEHKQILREVQQINSGIEKVWKEMGEKEEVCGLLLLRFTPVGISTHAHGCCDLRRAFKVVLGMCIEEGDIIPVGMAEIGRGKSG